MTLKVSAVDGAEYDDSEPRYFVVGAAPDEMCFDRVEHKIVTKASVIAAGGTAEIGAGSAAFAASIRVDGVSLADYASGLAGAGTPPGGGVVTPPKTPITANVAGAGTASATITFAAGPQDAAGTITIGGLASGGNAVAGLTPVATAAGDTAAVIAGKVAAAIEGKQDAGTSVTFKAVAAAGVVTVTEDAGGTIDAGLTATVA